MKAKVSPHSTKFSSSFRKPKGVESLAERSKERDNYVNNKPTNIVFTLTQNIFEKMMMMMTMNKISKNGFVFVAENNANCSVVTATRA